LLNRDKGGWVSEEIEMVNTMGLKKLNVRSLEPSCTGVITETIFMLHAEDAFAVMTGNEALLAANLEVHSADQKTRIHPGQSETHKKQAGESLQSGEAVMGGEEGNQIPHSHPRNLNRQQQGRMSARSGVECVAELRGQQGNRVGKLGRRRVVELDSWTTARIGGGGAEQETERREGESSNVREADCVEEAVVMEQDKRGETGEAVEARGRVAGILLRIFGKMIRCGGRGEGTRTSA